MPRIREIYPGAGLNAEDLPKDTDIPCTIESCNVREFEDGERKLVLTFLGKQKSLVVNSTNALMIAHVLGSDRTEDWIGQRIVLYVTPVQFQGKFVPGIRVRDFLPAGPMRQVAAPVAQPSQAGGWTPARTLAQPYQRNDTPQPVGAPAGPVLDTPLTDDDIPFSFVLPFVPFVTAALSVLS